ncbi:MAG: AAA family ATPase [Saprospiraceae bacterium]|nr:AAA family ATPase [Saprospiraceae bacterium]
MNINNSECNIINVKSLGLAYGEGTLTVDSLAKAVLAYPYTREIIARKLEEEACFLEEPGLVEFEIPDEIEAIAWPEELFSLFDSDSPEEDTSESDLSGLDFFDEEAEEEAEEEADVELLSESLEEEDFLSDFLEEDRDDFKLGGRISSLEDLLGKLYEEVKKPFWFKKGMFFDIETLAGKLDIAFQKTIELFPYHEVSLQKFRDMLFKQLYDGELSGCYERPLPVMVCSTKDNNLITVFRKLAGYLEYKFRFIDDISDNVEEWFSNEKMYPLSFNLIRYNDTNYEMDSELKKMLTYYETGYYYKKEDRDSSSLENLFSLTSENRNQFDDFYFRKHIIVYLLELNSDIVYDKGMTSEQIKSKILSFYKDSYKVEQYERMYYLFQKFKILLAASQGENLMYFDYGDKWKKIEVIRQYAASLMEKLAQWDFEYTKADLDKLVILAILKVGEYKVNQLKNSLRDVIYKLEDLLILNESGSGSRRLVFEPAFAELSKILEEDKIELISDKLLAECEENFIRQRKKISFSVRYVEENETIVIGEYQSRLALWEDSYFVPRPVIRFRDVIGCKEIKRRFQIIINYYRDVDLYKAKGVKISNRLLLIGAPGTGKTLIAQAFAGEIGLPFYSLSASEVTSQKWSGWGASLLRELFMKAKQNSPSVIFLDELDAFGKRSQFTGDDGGTGYDARSITNSLLVLLDGVEDNSDVIVIGATNRPEDLDEALMRSKRFGLKFEITGLTPDEREELIEMHLKPSHCISEYKSVVEHVKNRTYGNFSPAKIVEILEETKLYSIIEQERLVDIDDFDKIIDRIVLGKKINQLDDFSKKSTAIHEAGHAVAHRYLFPGKFISRLSIGHRKDSMGITLFSSFNEKETFSSIRSKDIVNYILISVAGSQAEKIEFGDWDIGSEQDMNIATQLSKWLVFSVDLGYGISPVIETSLFDMDQNPDQLSPEIKQIIIKLMELCLGRSKQILQANWEYVKRLAEELEKKEDLSQKEIDGILSGMPGCEKDFIQDVRKLITKI